MHVALAGAPRPRTLCCSSSIGTGGSSGATPGRENGFGVTPHHGGGGRWAVAQPTHARIYTTHEA